ncbi:MAG: CheR family methyltransferase [Rheinheimera sp.]|jgi:chemotaxis protein methyltransferase CheR
MSSHAISDQEFTAISQFFFAESGIRLGANKRSLVCGRLAPRLKALEMERYGDYLAFISSDRNQVERHMAVDLLTTNETYFFREMRHFNFLQQLLEQKWPGHVPQIWSAACSSGEEPYSIAMMLAEHLGDSAWQVDASDLSGRMLDTAAQGLYPLSRARDMPSGFLKKYCLKGLGAYEGYLLIDEALKRRVHLRSHNLMEPVQSTKKYDLIFLRNVLIYFDAEGKRKIIQHLVKVLQPDGYLFVGHSESLNGITDQLVPVRPAVYRLA